MICRKDETYGTLIGLVLSPTSEDRGVHYIYKASFISIYVSVSEMDQFSLTAPHTLFSLCLKMEKYPSEASYD